MNTLSETRERAKPLPNLVRKRKRVRIAEPHVKKKRRSPKQKPTRKFAMLPAFFIKQPATFGMTVLETSIAAALVRLATDKRSKSDRTIALDHGARMHRKLGDSQIKRERMSRSQKRKKNELKALPAEHVTLDISRSALLKAAFVSSGTRNVALVIAALDHFDEMPRGPVEEYKKFKNGSLRICVSKDWLPNRTHQDERLDRRWRRIPLPLPTNSLVAMNLAMFLRLTKEKDEGRPVYGIDIADLAECIGITSQSLFAQRQAIKRARLQVNDATWAWINQAKRDEGRDPDHFFYYDQIHGDHDQTVRFIRTREPRRDPEGRMIF